MNAVEIQLRLNRRQHHQLKKLAGITGESAAHIFTRLLEAMVAHDQAEELEHRIGSFANSLTIESSLAQRLRDPLEVITHSNDEQPTPFAIAREVATAVIAHCRRSIKSMVTICTGALEKWAVTRRQV